MKTFGVATKGVICNHKGEYLILKKSSSEDINPETYDLPGGRISFGEKLEEAVVREIKEETGLDVTPIKVFNTWTFTKDDNFQLVGIDFICKLEGGNSKLSEEHSEVSWMSYDEIVNNKKLPGWLVKTIQKAYSFISG